jgi:hypothetical protein
MAKHFPECDPQFACTCNKIRCKAYRDANLEKARESDRKRAPRNPRRPTGYHLPGCDRKEYNSRGACRGCVNAYGRDRRKKLGEQHLEYMRKLSRERNTGWTNEQYLAGLKAQVQQCAICGVGLSLKRGASNSVNADHDHETGRTRELLCLSCNTLLGQAKDSPKILAAAVAYILKHQSITAMLG